MNEMELAKRCATIAAIVAVLFIVLAACELPTPTASPLPTPAPELRAQPQRALAVAEPGTVTGTVEVWWDDPLIPTGFVTICSGVESGGPGTYTVYHVRYGSIGASVVIPDAYVVYYICEGDAVACAGYPATRTVAAASAAEACAVTLTLTLDFEARQDGAVLDADTREAGPAISAREPGHGRYDGAVSWRWSPELPEGTTGAVQVWRRARWADEGLPDVVIPFDMNGELRTPDERGFFLVAEFEVGMERFYHYLPIVARRGEP